MVSHSSKVSRDFVLQLEGYGLATAEILYRMPDHPGLLQTYLWQEYDLCPRFPNSTNSSSSGSASWTDGFIRSGWPIPVSSARPSCAPWTGCSC